MGTSQVRVHDCFDVLAGESKPLKCNCPNFVSPQEAQELTDSGKGKFLNRRSIVLLGVRNPAARLENREIFAANETDHDFVQRFRTLLPESELSESDVLDAIKNPEKFNGSDASPAVRQLSEHYWNKVLVNCRLPILSGQFLTDAVHGRGKLISGGIDSEKIPEPAAQTEKEIRGRVKAANFRKGEFNGGIISSPGCGPDEFSPEGWHGGSLLRYGTLAAPVNRNKFRCDPNQAELNAYFTWNMDQLFANVLWLQNKGYSEERIMAEISQNVNPVFSKKAVTLICRGCGIHTERVLHVPQDVPVLDKRSFICKKCNGLLTDEGRRMPPRKVAVLKEEAHAA